MLGVIVQVNGVAIYARTAVNQARLKNGKTVYRCDDGGTILHDPKDGAVALAQKLLVRIAEQGVDGKVATEEMDE